ncbi:MAG: hypothetical protein H0W65_06095 [Sphingomonas sp.]|uniref:hypothetical protein n=1 Tax=Sphingomonas sp. TaxID=28214 RepID=UPI0018387F8E|nr:hypothetical protein [Sphingomonas sp.]MBA3667276.1 hypothetical protein [Sphingomonas sp.]
MYALKSCPNSISLGWVQGGSLDGSGIYARQARRIGKYRNSGIGGGGDESQASESYQ